jgi:hypothetical protein
LNKHFAFLLNNNNYYNNETNRQFSIEIRCHRRHVKPKMTRNLSSCIGRNIMITAKILGTPDSAENLSPTAGTIADA